MNDLPPPRYQVQERGRRLETVDTLTGARITAGARAPINDGRMPGPRTSTDASHLSRPSRTDGGVAQLLVGLLCRGERLPDGRYVLRTSASFDERGPREIAVGPDAVRPLALFATIVGFAIIGLVAAFWAFGFPAIAFAGVAIGMIGQHGKGFVARLLDPLGKRIVKPDRD